MVACRWSGFHVCNVSNFCSSRLCSSPTTMQLISEASLASPDQRQLLPRAVIKFGMTEKIHFKAKPRLEASEWRLHEDNALLISNELELSNSEDKINDPNLYSHTKFDRKTEAGFFQIWKNFQGIHFNTPSFLLGVSSCDNAGKKGLSSPAKTKSLKYLRSHKKRGPYYVNF